MTGMSWDICQAQETPSDGMGLGEVMLGPSESQKLHTSME